VTALPTSSETNTAFAPPPKTVARRFLDVLVTIYPPVAILVAALLLASGCASQPAVAGKSSPEEPDARLAASRVGHAYPADLQVVGNAAARAVVLHGKDRLDLINLGEMPWPHGGRLWINGRFSCALPMTQPGVFARIEFGRFRDAEGQPLPTRLDDEPVERIEIEVAGELTNVRFALGY